MREYQHIHRIIRYIFAFPYITLFSLANLTLALLVAELLLPIWTCNKTNHNTKRCKKQQFFLVFYLLEQTRVVSQPLSHKCLKPTPLNKFVAAMLCSDFTSYGNTQQWNEKKWHWFFLLASSTIGSGLCKCGSVHKVFHLDVSTNQNIVIAHPWVQIPRKIDGTKVLSQSSWVKCAHTHMWQFRKRRHATLMLVPPFLRLWARQILIIFACCKIVGTR